MGKAVITGLLAGLTMLCLLCCCRGRLRWEQLLMHTFRCCSNSVIVKSTYHCCALSLVCSVSAHLLCRWQMTSCNLFC